MTRILAIDATLGGASVAILAGDAVLADRALAPGHGQAGALAPLVAATLAAAGLSPSSLTSIAVSIGPGSFTGLRASIALAQGLAAGARIPLAGIPVAAAFAEGLDLPGHALWVAIDSRRNRVFLDRAGSLATFALAELPRPETPVAIAGDAAALVACWLAARDANVLLTSRRAISAIDVARAARRGIAQPAQPIYVDPPEAKLPAGGLRPPPLP